MNNILFNSYVNLNTNFYINPNFIIDFNLKKNTYWSSKSSPFECGFNPKSSARLPFASQFFIITLLFLIFDVEMTLIIHVIISTKLYNMLTLIYLMMMFILILILGILHEWNQWALNWLI